MQNHYMAKRGGRFHFNSVANFNNQTPYRYYREVPSIDPTRDFKHFKRWNLWSVAN
jgi:hypothetical protein